MAPLPIPYVHLVAFAFLTCAATPLPPAFDNALPVPLFPFVL